MKKTELCEDENLLDIPDKTEKGIIRKMNSYEYNTEKVVQIKCNYYLEKEHLCKLLQIIANKEVAIDTTENPSEYGRAVYIEINYLRQLLESCRSKMDNLIKIAALMGINLE